MMKVGDEVIVMSAPGRFRVTVVDGELVTIENAEGIRKTVLEQSVRVVEKRNAT